MLKIYTCAFLNENYLNEAKISIESLRTNGAFDGPIYLITDMSCSIDGVNVIYASCPDVPTSSAFKLKVFEYIKDFSDDDIVLYLDTDIVLLKPIPSFNDIDDKINFYEYPSQKQNLIYFAGFITEDPEIISKQAFSAGLFVFRPSEAVKDTFSKAFSLFSDLNKKGKINGCWEQPALCYTVIKENMYTLSLTPYIYEERWKDWYIAPDGRPKESHIFNHFCALRGVNRQTEMKKYLIQKEETN